MLQLDRVRQAAKCKMIVASGFERLVLRKQTELYWWCMRAQDGLLWPDWLVGVRYAMIDEPQCALYSSASLPALPFELPVPWARPK